VPAVFAPFLAEPAFSMADTTFCIWRTNIDDTWHRGPVSFPGGDDPDGSQNLLWMLDGDPETYVSFTSDYYEKDLDIALVRKLYELESLTPLTASGINPETDWNDVMRDAEEIGYPISANP